ncbi:hypothetical protein [uncultured Brachyspira sp.]|uniref:hypothetical protein n=1 Tax=uncultured Brachyspira sp. TaxID=221953 RepID=UPI00258D9290|nr:hypothetical protein [uncultured Brachyspira sp.]
MGYIKELLTCSKTNTLSSMRLISLIGSLVLLFCITWCIITKDEKREELSFCLIGGLLGMNGFKTLQTKFEGTDKENNK